MGRDEFFYMAKSNANLTIWQVQMLFLTSEASFECIWTSGINEWKVVICWQEVVICMKPSRPKVEQCEGKWKIMFHYWTLDFHPDPTVLRNMCWMSLGIYVFPGDNDVWMDLKKLRRGWTTIWPRNVYFWHHAKIKRSFTLMVVWQCFS